MCIYIYIYIYRERERERERSLPRKYPAMCYEEETLIELVQRTQERKNTRERSSPHRDISTLT